MAFASTALVSWHMIPLFDATPPAHAIHLTKAEDPLFAKTGVNRITRQARRSPRSRELLLSGGAVPALAEVARRGDDDMKEAVARAVEQFAVDEQAALHIVDDEHIVGVLMGGSVAESVWQRILDHETARHRIKRRGICERVMREGTSEIQSLFVQEGVC